MVEVGKVQLMIECLLDPLSEMREWPAEVKVLRLSKRRPHFKYCQDLAKNECKVMGLDATSAWGGNLRYLYHLTMNLVLNHKKVP
jgi:hypothetical protein